MAHVAFPYESYTSGILPVSRREQNEVDDLKKSTSRDKSTNRDSPSVCSSTTNENVLESQAMLVILSRRWPQTFGS